jgi:hypothetical protein
MGSVLLAESIVHSGWNLRQRDRRDERAISCVRVCPCVSAPWWSLGVNLTHVPASLCQYKSHKYARQLSSGRERVKFGGASA